MENLNTILGINLHTASIFDINEEKLLLLKSEDYYTKSDLFFFLQNELLKNKNNKENCFNLVKIFLILDIIKEWFSSSS